jgi:hypothetical protein
MRKLDIKINNELHEVIYIDYNKGIPHSVITTQFIETAIKPYWMLIYWDMFLEKGSKNHLRHYKSGSGGEIKDILAPQWCNGYIGEFWIKQGLEFKNKVKNGKMLEYPKRIKIGLLSSINPLKISEISYGENYCKKCGEYSEDYCWDHVFEDEYGDIRYISDKQLVD